MRIDRAGSRAALSSAVVALTLGSGGAALAQTGQPAPWQMNFQTPVTNIAQDVVSFHNLLLWLITAISLFVLFLLVYVCWKFNEKANPVPSKTTHHTWIEVAWTVIPVLILVGISIPSFRILREQLTIPQADVVIKATGHSWYWSYEYPADQGGFRFESNMVPDDQLKPGQPRLLAVDNEVVVPVNKIVKVQITAGRRSPQLRGALLRHPPRRRARPPQRDLVQGHPRGHLLRPVLGAVRQRPPLHADPGPRGERRAVRRLDRGIQEEVRCG
jgi:cytochrome c oxidase subunit 2